YRLAAGRHQTAPARTPCPPSRLGLRRYTLRGIARKTIESQRPRIGGRAAVNLAEPSLENWPPRRYDQALRVHPFDHIVSLALAGRGFPSLRWLGSATRNEAHSFVEPVASVCCIPLARGARACPPHGFPSGPCPGRHAAPRGDHEFDRRQARPDP